jgi:septum formation protein
MTRLVLGSASPGRLGVLRGAGVDPLVVVSGVDEDAVVAGLADDAGPGEVTVALAVAKALAVAAALDPGTAADCVVIGCDSMLYRDGTLWGKPGTPEAALNGWRAVAGRSALLYTGHCVIRLRDNIIDATAAEPAVTTVRFGSPSEADLAAYVATGEPLGVAGGFTIDGLAGWFIEGVDGDPSAVIGLGLPLTARLLGQVGISVADLWRANPLP